MNATKVSLLAIGLAVFCALSMASTVMAQETTVGEIAFSENGISITPIAGLETVMAEMLTQEGVVIRKAISGSAVISNAEFDAVPDGIYHLTLSAETGNILQKQGRVEDGREAKLYILKETVTQDTTVRISDHKVVVPNTEE